MLVKILDKNRGMKSPFHIFDKWSKHPDFLNNIIKRVWRTPVSGWSMFRVFQKLKLFRGELRVLNRRDLSHILYKAK